MKRLFLPIVFLAFIQFASAQVSDQDVPRTARDQVIPDDLIVQGSECVGLDCVNNESFGFSTIILKENNLRIKFFDTSTGTFPSNDWTLEANSSANGGTNHFAIVDDNLGRVPFKIIAGAPTNSLFVASSGDLGIGTGNPVVEVHVADGDSPGLRLEQNGSSGFTPQTWDIAGNEANFFVRDVTGGSLLPFRIQPGAPSNSLYIKGDGNVGIGTQSPAEKLTIYDGSILISNQKFLNSLRSNGNTIHQVFGMDANNDVVINRSAITADLASNLIFGATNTKAFKFLNQDGIQQMKLEAGSGNLTLDQGDAFKTGGGEWSTISDKRAKKNIRSFDDGLEEVLQINPIFYQYNGKYGTPNTGKEFIGVLAQEIQKVTPYIVKELKSGKDHYFTVDASSIKYMLINAIKDQQKIIEDQQEQIKAQDERITDLEATVVELRNLIQDLRNSVEVNLSGEDLGYLGQNVPNPYQGETTITYVVPGKATSSAINIYDVSGKFIKTVSIKQTGKGQLKINAHNLPGGVYSYQLVVDGKVIDSKKMVLQN